MMTFERYPKITAAAARVNAGLTQQQASERLGISKASLLNYETGKRMPPWDLVQRMEDVYNFPADFIVFNPTTVKPYNGEDEEDA